MPYLPRLLVSKHILYHPLKSANDIGIRSAWFGVVIEDLDTNNGRLFGDPVGLAGNRTSAMSAMAKDILVTNSLVPNDLRSTNGSSFEVHMLMVDSGVKDVGDGSFAGSFVVILETVLVCAR